MLSLVLFPKSETALTTGANRKPSYDLTQEKLIINKNFKRTEISVVVGNSKRSIESWQYLQENDRQRIERGETPEKPIVVLFHPNSALGSDMELLSRMYIHRGYNVIMPTMGGYPGSPGIRTSEASAYQDIEAMKLYLSDMGFSSVGFHGISLGGALAVHAAATENPSGMQTAFVVADQTFPSAEDAGGNLAANLLGKSAESVGRGIMRAAIPKNQPVELPGGKTTTTDGFNSMSKMTLLKEKGINVVFIATAHDIFMGRGEYDKKKGYERDYAHEMSQSVYGNEADRHVVRLKGKGHAESINGYYSGKDADEKAGNIHQTLIEVENLFNLIKRGLVAQ